MKVSMARIFAAFALILVLAIAGFYVSIFAAAVHNRSIASKLLIRIRELKPGQTSEAEARLLLKPFAAYEDRYSQTVAAGEKPTCASEYAFSNVPDWEGKLLGRFSVETNQAIQHVMLPWTRFSVDLKYRDGVLSSMRVEEGQQEHPDEVHPVAASVEILSTRFEQIEPSAEPNDFSGFFAHHQNTQAYDGSHPVGSPCCEEEFTVLDERATPQQRSQSLNFQLRCLDALKPCNTVNALRPRS
jgi:hypothetical protein